MMTVPSGVEEFITKSENQDVFDHLFAQVMVDAKDLLFIPVRLQGLL
jgi:hypothetical protein